MTQAPFSSFCFNPGDLVELHSLHPCRPTTAILFNAYSTEHPDRLDIDSVQVVPNGTIVFLLEELHEETVLASVLYKETKYLALAEQIRPLKHALLPVKEEAQGIDLQVGAG